MTAEETQDLVEYIEGDGFDYVFIHGSNFSEVEDLEFHKLRTIYIQAQESLALYIKKQAKKHKVEIECLF